MLQDDGTGTNGDFDQINEVLATTTIKINDTTISLGDEEGGILTLIDLNMQFDVTEQVEELLVDTVIEIPSDVLTGARRHRERRQLKDSCPAPGTDGDATFSIDQEQVLELVANNLELMFGDEINLLLEDFPVEINDTCLSLGALTGGGTTANLNANSFSALMSETNVNSMIQDDVTLSFGKELSCFLEETFVIEPDDIFQRDRINVLGVLFNLDLNVTELKCDHFTLESLDVLIKNNGGDFTGVDSLNLDISVLAKALRGRCSGKVSYGVGDLVAEARFEIQLIGNTFALDFNFAGGSLTLTSCFAVVSVEKVKITDVTILFLNLSDEFVARIFEIVRELVETTLINAVNPCTFNVYEIFNTVLALCVFSPTPLLNSNSNL